MYSKKIKLLSFLVSVFVFISMLSTGMPFVLAEESGDSTILNTFYTDNFGDKVWGGDWQMSSADLDKGGIVPSPEKPEQLIESNPAPVPAAGSKARTVCPWVGKKGCFYIFHDGDLDYSKYIDTGYLAFYMYAPKNNDIRISLQDGETPVNTAAVNLNKYYTGDNTWQKIYIPFKDFQEAYPKFNFAKFNKVLFGDCTVQFSVDEVVFYGSVKDVPVKETPAAAEDDPAPAAAAQSYYVSPEGSDTNDGKSPEKPFKTPQKGADTANPGDTVYFMDGEFTCPDFTNMLNVRKSGKENAWITYKAYQGAKPILKQTSGWAIIDIQASYIMIDGLILRGNADKVTLEQAMKNYDDVKANSGSPDYDWNKLTTTCTTGISIYGDKVYNSSKTILTHITVKNCDISYCTAAGIGSQQADYITIENNKVYNNAWYDVWGNSGITVLGAQNSDDNTKDYKYIIRNNVSHGNRCKIPAYLLGVITDGNGIIIDCFDITTIGKGEPYRGRTLVANNICYENGGSGIHTFRSHNVDVVNNVIYNNNQSPELSKWANLFANDSHQIRFLNNIVVSDNDSNLIWAPSDDSIIYDNNIYYSTTKKPAYMGKNDQNADPEFVNLEKKDFRLTKDSPAVDMGTRQFAPDTDIEGNARPFGNGFDIGAYESGYISETPFVENADYTNLVETAPEKTDDSTQPESNQTSTAYAEAAKGTPKIDGEKDGLWQNTGKAYTGLYTRTETSRADKTYARANAGILWDEQYLYVYAEVIDPLLSAKASDPWCQDSVEVYVDENNGKTKTYETDDGQYRINFNNELSGWNVNTSKVISAVRKTKDGYNVEAAIPWIKLKPVSGMEIGFDVQVNDDTGAGTQEGIMKWSDWTNNAHIDTSVFGTLKLVTEMKENDITPHFSVKDVLIDGKKVVFHGTGPQLKGEDALIPLRGVFETLGASVTWDNSTQTVTAVKGSKKITLQIGSRYADVNGSKIRLDEPAVIVNGRTLIPIRFITDSFGVSVDWDAATGNVVIKSK